jgi:hypothetical protein
MFRGFLKRLFWLLSWLIHYKCLITEFTAATVARTHSVICTDRQKKIFFCRESSGALELAARLCQTGSRQGGIQECIEELEELATALSSDKKQ